MRSAMLTTVDLVEKLEQLERTGGATTARERLLAALEMYDEGVALQRLGLQRRHPHLSPAELEKLLQRWLARDEAR